MANQVKKFALVLPKPGLSNEAFSQYWRGTHGPLVAGSPGYGDWRLRYVQNHVQAPGPIGKPFEFSGIAEFWLPGRSPNEDAFASTPIYQDRIRLDEQKFLDLDRTVSFSAIEEVLIPGNGKVKLVILSTAVPGLSRAELQTRYVEAQQAAMKSSAFARCIRGWAINHTIEGSFRLTGGRAANPLSVDSVEECWFDTSDDLTSAISAVAASKSNVWPALDHLFLNRQSFLAKEFVLFDVMKGRSE